MFLLPARIREFLLGLKKKTRRAYLLDQELNLALREVAQKQGRPEEEVLQDFARKGQEQFSREGDLEARWDSLTGREKEVLALACMGQRNHEIAQTLGIAVETVKSHLQNIFYKFGMRSRRELRLAMQNWEFEKWWQDHHR
jgi:ATP/maltotriose-dependent transcriptional regulator MalT